ncbi:shikimate dehydrogenase [Nocardioides campestrisoli]|uniref:shikimate dehydrogenase n=1 Tax=Nocardioides campestrisoli TaxID=2736757 RepID=UPI0015E69015|nr:shikimate dehydrogenase [Nocardioides campestrisoli]
MTSSSRRCAVLGDPVAHSLSPVLHRAGYAELGLDWSYEARRVPAGGLAGFVDRLDATWRGLSVTMPLKHEAHARADRLTPVARTAGVVNTLVLADDGTVLGDNTDLPGAVAAVRERTDAALRHAVILGGGATATSLGLALVGLGVTAVDLLVRTPERAAGTAAALRAHPAEPRVRVLPLTPGDADAAVGGALDQGAADIVVSTVPAAAQTAELVERLRDATCLFDVVYDPWPTPLAKTARGVVVSGLDLLVHQAALQFTLFTGEPAPLARMRAAGEQALAERSRTGAGA